MEIRATAALPASCTNESLNREERNEEDSETKCSCVWKREREGVMERE